MKPVLMVILLPLIKVVAGIARCWPRSRQIWVFGSYMNSFTDNSKYLFAYLTDEHPEISAVWVSGDLDVVQRIRAAGGRAYARWSFCGIYFALRGKFWFVSAYASDINVYLSRGACLVNLWHGIPLKKIEFDIENGPLARQFHEPTFWERHLFNAHLFRIPDWVISTSEYVTASSFSPPFAFRLTAVLALVILA